MEEQESQKDQVPEGWYNYAGGKRFYDGNEWTDHFAYVAPPQNSIGWFGVMSAVTIGCLLAFFIILTIANEAPDDVFFPIKFLVDPDRADGLGL